jgi:Flp pilus assembly protein TadD
MSKHYKRIPLLTAAIISLGLTMAGHAYAGDLRQGKQTKQLVEGLYSNNLDAAAYFQQGVTQYNRSNFKGAELAFRKALIYDPSIAMAHYLLGMLSSSKVRQSRQVSNTNVPLVLTLG